MHALARKFASIRLRQLVNTTSAGIKSVSGSQKVSGMLKEGHHDVASSSGKSPAMQPESLWQQLVNAGKPNANGKEQKIRRQQVMITGRASVMSCSKSTGPKLKPHHGQPHTAAQARPGKEGTTDLGQGAVVMYLPAIFPARQSVALYHSLQVCISS
jgi:hypothetical protein